MKGMVSQAGLVCRCPYICYALVQKDNGPGSGTDVTALDTTPTATSAAGTVFSRGLGHVSTRKRVHGAVQSFAAGAVQFRMAALNKGLIKAL